MGYGAMQLAGPGVWGPPKDLDGAVAVLREAVAAGVNHIDTADYYGPHVTNQIVRQALHPYPAGLVIVTKLGGRRPPDKSWQPAISPQELTAGVHDNLRNLGLDVLDIVNYRVMGSGHGPEEGSIAAQMTVLADLQRKGLIRHIGLSNVTPLKWPKRGPSPTSYAYRITTIWPTATTTPLSTSLDDRASLTCHSFRWEDSRRCSPLPSTRPQRP
jgi:aryl-alcohol dehydrogenase-like predicted oxidoreductase